MLRPLPLDALPAKRGGTPVRTGLPGSGLPARGRASHHAVAARAIWNREASGVARERTCLGAIGAGLLAAACAVLGPQPREVVITAAQLEQALVRQFSGPRTFLALFDVNLSNPRVLLQPSDSRVRSEMDVAISNALIGESLKGSTAISGRLSFDPGSGTVRLVEPRAEDFRVEGVPERWAAPVGRIGAWLTEQVLREFPVYAPRPEDLRIEGVDYAPSAFAVRADGIVVTLTPQAK